MFDHILAREREVFWQYGEVTCAAFSLKDLDSVSILSLTIGSSSCVGARQEKKLEIHLPSELLWLILDFTFPAL